MQKKPEEIAHCAENKPTALCLNTDCKKRDDCKRAYWNGGGECSYLWLHEAMNTDCPHFLKKEKIMIEKYYYFRSNENKPRITVCILANPATKEYSRGVAICSKQDNPCKKTGRKIAKERALFALKIKDNELYINEGKYFNYLCENGKWIDHRVSELECKAAYMPEPINHIELKILSDISEVQ